MTEIIHGRRALVTKENMILKWWRSIDQWTLICSLILILLGLLLSMAASVPLAESNEKPAFYYVYRQLVYGCISFALILFLSGRSLNFIRRFSVIGFSLTVIALTLLPFFGTDFGKGAVRWFSFNFFTIQPSEFLKPFFIVFIAWIISGNQDRNSRLGLAISFICLVFCVLCLTVQPDLGQTVLIISSWTVIHFVIGISIITSLFFGLFLFGVGSIFYNYSDYVADRLSNFFF
jgi:cell division protein FtsW